MSKIIGELLKATGATKQGRKEDPQDFFERIMVATSKITDDEFDDLSEETQDWCNEASIYINKRKDVPDPEDFGGAGDDENTARGRVRGRVRKAKDGSENKPARGRKGSGRGRSAAKSEGPEVGKEIAFADIKEGMVLSNVDGELEGEVVKVLARLFTLATDDGEEKITKTQAKGSILEEMPEGEPEPKKKVRTARGRGRGTSRASGRSGGRGKKEADDSSAVQAIRELLAEEPDMTIDEVGEALEDDGVEFKPATLKLTYNTFCEIYELLEKKGALAD